MARKAHEAAKKQEMKRELDAQLAEKKALREVVRLFPEGRLTSTSH